MKLVTFIFVPLVFQKKAKGGTSILNTTYNAIVELTELIEFFRSLI